MLFYFLALFFLFIAFGISIAFCLGLVDIILLYKMKIDFMALPQKAFFGINNFPLLAIPFFLFVGQVLDRGGIAKRLVDFCNSLIGYLIGGLGHVTVLTSMFFGGISGSAVAETSAIGGVLIPAMTKEKYPTRYAAALVMSSSIIGILIPPSIPFILYGIATNTSITKLFIGGIVPGIVLSFFLMVTNYIIVKRNAYGPDVKVEGHKFNIHYVVTSFKGAWMALTVPAVIIGGILYGIFTATEAGAIAALISVILSVFVYKEIKMTELPHIFLNVAKTTGVVMFLLGMASCAAWIMTLGQVPVNLANTMLSITHSPMGLMIIVNILLVLVGCVMDFPPAMLVLAPIIVPMMTKAGFDPIYFGVIMSMNLAIGLITPPVGTALYVACGVAKLDMMEIVKANMPFYVTLVFVLGLLVAFPNLVMFLPNIM